MFTNADTELNRYSSGMERWCRNSQNFIQKAVNPTQIYFLWDSETGSFAVFSEPLASDLVLAIVELEFFRLLQFFRLAGNFQLQEVLFLGEFLVFGQQSCVSGVFFFRHVFDELCLVLNLSSGKGKGLKDSLRIEIPALTCSAPNGASCQGTRASSGNSRNSRLSLRHREWFSDSDLPGAAWRQFCWRSSWFPWSGDPSEVPCRPSSQRRGQISSSRLQE